jgi:hypothetical protein
MHQHPLYHSVTVRCECCRIEREFAFTSPYDQVVCKSCERHTGNSPERLELRRHDHLGLYWSELEVCREDRKSDAREAEARTQQVREELRERLAERDQTIAERDVLIADLRHAIQESELNPAVEEWLADDMVRTAYAKRDSAYRARDFALRTIWRFAQIHDGDPERDDHCACGRKADRCAELAAIADELPAMREWEQIQIERLLDDLEHGLPPEHPDVRKRPGWARRSYGQRGLA